MKYHMLICPLVFAFLSFADAQTRPAGEVAFVAETFELPLPLEGDAHLYPPIADGTFIFISSEFEASDKVVKGSPYSAEAVTERVETLADGNRIVHKSQAKIFRDSQGRTRREQEFGLIGNLTAAGDPPKRVFINDPVAGTHYVLDPERETARKMEIPKIKIERKDHAALKPEMPHPKEEEVDIMFAPASPHVGVGKGIRFFHEPGESKTETLGKMMFEGFQADGTRTTTTIPAGKIGNELPITIVSEKWYSPQLQVNLKTVHFDPRFGETNYTLTNLRRGEPDPSLFQIPRHYKVEKASAGKFFKERIVPQ